MSSSHRLIDLGLVEFSDAVALRDSAPAAGSVAAATGLLGTSLAVLVTRLAAGHQDSGQGPYLEGRAEELEDLARCQLELVDRDAEAYRAYVALGPPDPASPAQERRQRVTREVVEAPLEVAEFALAALRLLAAGRELVPAVVRPDQAVAARTLLAAVEGGLDVARANLSLLEPGPGAADAADLAATLVALGAEARALGAALLDGGGAPA